MIKQTNLFGCIQQNSVDLALKLIENLNLEVKIRKEWLMQVVRTKRAVKQLNFIKY